MIKNKIYIASFIILSLLAGLYIGYKYGYKEGCFYVVKYDADRIMRSEKTIDIAISFVSLKSVVEKDDANAIKTLNDYLSSSVRQLTDYYYDKNDTESAGHILELINTVTEWREKSGIDYDNSDKLDVALQTFNEKHNH